MRLLIIMLIFLLSACGGSAPQTRYYLVEATAPAPLNLDETPAVAIMDLEIPQYLERSQIASRRPDNQLVFASSHQWGESLRKNLARAFARNLTNQLASSAVGTPANRLTTF